MLLSWSVAGSKYERWRWWRCRVTAGLWYPKPVIWGNIINISIDSVSSIHHISCLDVPYLMFTEDLSWSILVLYTTCEFPCVLVTYLFLLCSLFSVPNYAKNHYASCQSSPSHLHSSFFFPSVSFFSPILILFPLPSWLQFLISAVFTSVE